MTAGPWPVHHQVGPAGAFHDRPLPEPFEPALWWFEVDRPTVVLGSTQADEVVDRAAAARAGVEVVRRRSGGGAVWLAPGEAVWVDVLLPAADPRWDDDVVRSSRWLGEAWVRALASFGVTDAVVHEGALQAGPWSSLVCFGGLGPGEVTVGGHKLVGLSQRRSRAGARFQGALLRRWDPDPLLDVLALPPSVRARARADLAPGAPGAPTGLDGLAGVEGAVDPAAVVAALRAEVASNT